MTKEQIINNYLYFGYLPLQEYPAWLNEIEQNEQDDYTLQGAIKNFDETFDKLVQRFPDKKYVIPLSGGWDSRAILGALLERVDKSQITTYSFGKSGQLDYEIGLQIAHWAGVKSNNIDLSDILLSWEKITNHVNNIPWSRFPDTFYNSISRLNISGSKQIVWSGFLGDAVSGGHLNQKDSNSLYVTFLQKNKYIKSFNVVDEEFEPLQYLEIPRKTGLTNDVLMDLLVTQSSGNAPVSLSHKFVKNEDSINYGTSSNKLVIVAPFAEKNFIQYWLNAPRELRMNQKLYLEMLHAKFPELFTLPSKYSLGLPPNAHFRYGLKRYHSALVRRIQKRAPWLGIRSIAHLNYLDYDEIFRTRADYQEALTVALNYLKENNLTPWINFDILLKEHMKRKKNHGNVFCLLIGLAANLQVNYQENEI